MSEVTTVLLPLLVLLPVAAGGALAVVPERARAAVAVVVVVATALASLVVALDVARTGTAEVVLAGWDLPVGLALRADAVTAAMLGLTAVVAPAVTLYATGHAKVRGTGAFWPLWLLLLGALNGVWVAGDLFNAYVTLELVTVAAVCLVALGGRARPAPRCGTCTSPSSGRCCSCSRSRSSTARPARSTSPSRVRGWPTARCCPWCWCCAPSGSAPRSRSCRSTRGCPWRTRPPPPR
ncbi:hypothetical protein GCM10025875_13200 [Litorihabitans aurantiacus]|uniref:NADH:quinone oxidoreductase/Mrp antiporter membrane subunit domain-containing protein n=1 Tax=Litorihabitans aurantiacus TaxID=1930061 RepID=A0AA37USI2_9MICO|nr:hypothetical protein GCM10025875_13200 [Litorihabitans aurantiacus]